MESKEFLKESQSLKVAFMNYFDGIYNYVDPEVNISTYELGLTNLTLLPTGELEVELRRPGLLIGRGGKAIDRLQKYLEVKIKIKEKKFI